MTRRCVFVALALLLVPAAAMVRAQQPTTKSQWPTYPPGKRLEVLRRVSGGFPADGRRERLRHDFIADERTWGEFLQILGGKALRPTVDFEHEIVLVGIVDDARNTLFLDSHIDDRGNVTSGSLSSLVDYTNPQHGSYVLHVVAREGIKTVNGKPVRKGIWRKVNDSDARRGDGQDIRR